MNHIKQNALTKGYSFADKYTVLLLIKRSSTAETYRVRDVDGRLLFLKLFDVAKVHYTAFDGEGNLLEIEFLKRIKHPNIAGYHDSGEVIIKGKKFFYLVLDFIVGETLAERMARKPISTIYDVRQFLSDVLNGLHYIHSLPEPIIHNEITPQNIMLDLSGETPVAKIVDFGYARSFLQSSKAYYREGLDMNFMASECITAGAFSPQSDLFSIGVVMYEMLFGVAPWDVNISSYAAVVGRSLSLQMEQRAKPLRFPNVADRIVDFDASVLDIISKALQTDIDKRFQTAKEFLQVLNGEFEISEIEPLRAKPKENQGDQLSHSPNKKGKGFAAIAGMQHLKDMLQADVIDIMHNPEEYRAHGLGLPNGMLLYGPPGCGKTFFAERFAEEAGYHFKKVIASDIASIYVHGTQEKIGKLFDEARKNAPSILYFDELDAMVPDRANQYNHQGSEVNEFLSQLDNTGDSGVFVIGSTNQPQLIDKAILRAGRLEKQFYVPPPDFEARRVMFELYLKDRPLDFGIDYEKLATLTESYVSSDIKLICDESSRKVIREKSKRVTMETLELIIKNQSPSISSDLLKKYEAMRFEMEGVKKARNRVGFN